ncbi:cell division protein ZipA [SAR92 clade bacterium H455]|uniref:Cell division protein ZipA n=1 Tax=SAR92 clade bacterium H455 TaxID=2974818 RepID=A0ABY5TL35_9GAMM|nr:cell division protein ZipA [SAR92 clade bacterium H455]
MDVIGPREVLIAVGLLVLLAVILDGARRIKQHRYESLHMSSRKLQKNSRTDDFEDPLNDSQFPSGGSRLVGIRDEEDIQQVEENLRRALENGPDFRHKQPKQEQFQLNEEPVASARVSPRAAKLAKPASAKTTSGQQQILIMHLMAPKGEVLSGQQLQEAALNVGLRYGELKIFQRHLHEDGSGEVLFSMANLVNPGTFDLKTIDQMTTPGVTLFMALDDIDDPVSAFDIMVESVDSMASVMNLSVLDETRSSMTRQTIDHYRQRARDVSFRRSQGQ